MPGSCSPAGGDTDRSFRCSAKPRLHFGVGWTLEAMSFPPCLAGLAQLPWQLSGLVFSVQGPESAQGPDCHSGNLPSPQPRARSYGCYPQMSLRFRSHHSSQLTTQSTIPLPSATPNCQFSLFNPSLPCVFGKSKFHP